MYGANREAETENFDQERETLKALVSEYDGYFASDLLTQSDGARCLTSEIRVPAERLDEFVTALDDVGTTLSLESTANDVAAYYYDADARLGTQQAIVARLNQLIPEAQGDELQALNDQLEEAYAAIDELQKLLNRYDSDISYATVRMTLWEKSQFAPEPTKEPTLGERSPFRLPAVAACRGQVLPGHGRVAGGDRAGGGHPDRRGNCCGRDHLHYSKKEKVRGENE